MLNQCLYHGATGNCTWPQTALALSSTIPLNTSKVVPFLCLLKSPLEAPLSPMLSVCADSAEGVKFATVT